jgi:hypothetical protein
MAELPEGFVLEGGTLPSGFQLEEGPQGATGLKGAAVYGLQGAMRGLTAPLDLPGQLMNLVTGRQDRTLGQTVRQAIGGAQERVGAATGLSAPGTSYQYETIEQVPPEFRPSARAGEASGSALPFIGGLSLAARGAPITQTVERAMAAPASAGAGAAGAQAVRQMVADAASNPYFLASQLPATAGASLGAYGAEVVAPGSELAQMAGQFGGGLLGAAGAAAGISGLRAGTGQFAAAFPGTEEAARVTAGRQLAPLLQQAGEAPEQIIQRLRTPDVVQGALPAELAQSRAITGVQRYLAGRDTELANALATSREQVAQNIRTGVQEAFEPGQMQALTQAAATRQRAFNQRLDDLVTSAETRAQAAVAQTEAAGAERVAASRLAATEQAGAAAEAAAPIAPLSPGQARGLNVQARTILEDALAKARSEERNLWKQVPRDVEIQPVRVMSAYDDLRAGMIPEERMPGVIDNVMRRYRESIDEGTPVSSGELLSLRSTLLDQARDFRAQNNFSDARRARALADAALDDLEAIGGNAAATARDFSRALNDRFSRSFAGDVLGTKPSGAERVRPELTLEAATAGQPERVAAQLSELRTAVADQAPAMQAVQQDFLRTLTERIIDPTTGAVIPRRADAFLRDNAAILEQFPQVRDSIRRAAEAQRAAETAGAAVPAAEKAATQAVTETQRQADRVVSDVLKRTGDAGKEAERVAAFSRVLAAGENPQNAVASALRSANPVRELTRLSSLALRGGPEAVGGLRAATLRYAMDDATSRTTGLSYGKLSESLTDAVSDRGLSVLGTLERNKILTGQQRREIEALVKRGIEREIADTTGIEVNKFGTAYGQAIELAARVVGANAGSAFSSGGGASMQTANIMSGYFRNLVSKLPADKVNAVMAKALKSESPDELIRILERAAQFTPTGAQRVIDPMTREALAALRVMLVAPGAESERPPGGAAAFRPEMLGRR